MSSRVFYSIAWLVPICSALFYFSNKVFLTEQDSPIMLNFGSSFFSLIFSSFIFIRSEKISTLKNIDKISWVYIIFIGILMGVLARLVLLYGQSLTTASNAGFLVRTSPVFTIVLGYFFLNEKI
ncbi:DMT family transporter, partial [Candidatus Entotheonella palauensis]|uniref:DMT family transporter n=1 Tax=Candidatus Entotheonella palauensis TaxID=93172 RepID=UPI001C4DF118